MTTTPYRGPDISRRGLLAGVGGLSFAFALGATGRGLFTPAEARGQPRPLSAWVDIRPDDTIRIYSPGAEMGQGSLTGLAIIVAEELDADWDKVEIAFAPSEVDTYGYNVRGSRSMAIVGSRAVMMYHDDLRRAGASVRKVLVGAAAERWGVDPATLRTEPSVVVDPASGRRLSYGEIAAFAEAPAELPAIDDGELKRKSDFRLIGKAVPRADIPAKVDGSAEFAIDVQLPGMAYATALHSPVQNGRPASWNDEEVRALPGIVRTVGLQDGVAIVADSFERALKARNRLKVEWQGARAAGFNSERALTEEYARVHADPAAERETLDSHGDADAAFRTAAKTYRSEYLSDLGYHAQMEPLNAVARFSEAGDHVEVWDGTQAPDRCREMVAEALGFGVEQVTVHQCYMGGAFGRRSLADYAVEAALIAREAGRPVKLIWTREEDLAHGMFRPQAFQCLEAAADAAGKVVGWRHCVVGDGGNLLSSGIRIPYYAIPNQHIERRGVSHGVRLKHWRAVGHPFNIFAIDSLVDEMAADAGMDPIAFRLERMSATPRARALFEKVAEMSDWGSPRPDGRALGASITERSGSLGAGVVEISLNQDTGRIRVHKVWLAVDGGLIVLPDAARANIESGIVYGLSSVLSERVTVTDGIVDQSNYHDYPVMRMSETPEEMHIEFVDFGTPPTGLGEIGNPMPPAAVANAFYALTGKRLRHMPFTPDRVLAALRA